MRTESSGQRASRASGEKNVVMKLEAVVMFIATVILLLAMFSSSLPVDQVSSITGSLPFKVVSAR